VGLPYGVPPDALVANEPPKCSAEKTKPVLTQRNGCVQAKLGSAKTRKLSRRRRRRPDERSSETASPTRGCHLPPAGLVFGYVRNERYTGSLEGGGATTNEQCDHALTGDVEVLGQGFGNIKSAIAVERAKVIDANVCGSSVERVPHQEFCAIWKDRACRSCRIVGVKTLA
jgi:hypothetical protein